MDDSGVQPALPLTLLLGGVRAGKSSKALQLAQALQTTMPHSNVLFVATAQAFDDEMTQRIAAHKAERPEHWHTLEEPVAIASGIAETLKRHGDIGVVIIDCLTLWVSNLLLADLDSANIEATVVARTNDLLSLLKSIAGVNSDGTISRRFIIVSNEVGLGVVPPTPLGRKYRDALGRANQLVAAAASEVTFMIAGLELPIKPRVGGAQSVV